MKKIVVFILVNILLIGAKSQMPSSNIQYINSFNNLNHPEIAYWFFNKDMLNEISWKNKIDSLAISSKYTLIFLTARNGVDFFETEKMKPIFTNLVAYAHKKGIQIGLQLWGTPKNTSEASCERMVLENETTLDNNGLGNIYSKAKHIRAQSGKPFKSTLLKAYLFKKAGNGFYVPGSLIDITDQCQLIKTTDSSVALHIQQNKKYAGYTVYITTQHFYNVSSNHSQEAIDKFLNIIEAYKNIPFDGVGLDEYTNLKLFAIWELQKVNEPLRERLYSLDMARKYNEWYHYNLERALLDMRYAPVNEPEIRIKAINTYMDIMRKGTLNVESAMYDCAKKTFGQNTFIGLHDSHHNSLDGDEVWQTGINWWNVKREYGHTDESTPTPTQMGIAYGYSKHILYNMFYDKQINKIQEKAYTDLQYNIRTHYHAINDVQNWGISVERPYALEKINPVENCARLLNHFNPPLPEIKLLVVFGREALMNWYPDTTQRGICDINDKLKIEEKATQIWEQGYLNALVPTDVIEDGQLIVNEKGKAVYNGYEFEAVVFLYPEYAKEKTLHFLEQYVKKNGKLMLEGTATKSFLGQDISMRWNKIANRATVNSFDLKALSRLGINKNNRPNSIKMLDGSYLFSNYENFNKGIAANFKQLFEGHLFEGTYNGYVALQVKNSYIEKFAATIFQELKVNGKVLLLLSKPADVLIEKKDKKYLITIAPKDVKVLNNELSIF
jgi:hypothetical protein